MTTWTALSVPGVCGAALAWNAVTVVGIAATVTVPLALVLLLLSHGEDQGNTSPHKGSANLGWVARICLCAATLIIATSVIAQTLPALVLFWMLAAGASTPPIVDVWRRMLSPSGPQVTHSGSAELVPDPRSPEPSPKVVHAVGAMNDAELCRAWRHTFWTLRTATTATQRLEIVQHRQSILDELEARHADALRAWLASGDRACESPERFLRGEGDQSSAA